MAVCKKCGSVLLSTGVCSNPLCETTDEQLPTLWNFVESNTNIILDNGINWFTLYQVTEDQLVTLRKILQRDFRRYDINLEPDVGLLANFASRIRLRKLYLDERLWPGKEEKCKTIAEIKKYKETGEHTGIHPDSYDKLLVRLEAISDFDDIVGYAIHIHL